MSSAPQGTLGPYRLLEELACPSGGRAFRAIDPSSATPILLHLLPANVPDELLRQTRRLSRLHRPGIPVLYEVGTAPEGTFVAFAPPPGKTLTEFVTQGGRVDRATLVDWIAQTLGLLAEAHAEEILHRNLSADTVIIGEDGTLGVSGFGLTNLTPEAPELQSPERQVGARLSPASDLYSLSALFQRLAAPADLGGAARTPLAQNDPLIAVLRRGCHPDPSKRFQDAADMEMVVRRAEEPLQIQDMAFQTMAMQAPALQELLAKEAPGARRTEEPPPSAAPPRQVEAQKTTEPADSGRPVAAGAAAAIQGPPRTPAPTSPGAPPPASRRRSGPIVVAVILLLMAAFAALAYRQSRQMHAARMARQQATATPSPSVQEAANGDDSEGPAKVPGTFHEVSANVPGTPSGSPSESDGIDAQDPALRLARLLLQDGDALFGAVELAEDEREILEDVQTDIAEVSFGDDPTGAEPAQSLFGENPLLAKQNPLLTEEMRERWLGDAIQNLGSDHAMEHLREETERLRRGEVNRAEWYAHVAQCKDFCNRVVSGLLYEHVQQVRQQPKYLVLFPNSGTDLSTEYRAALEGFLSTQQETTHLLLIGRSSRGGSRDYNRELSSQRVEAVREAAQALGIDDERINAFWLGFEPPRLTPELARVYGLKADVALEELNQSVLVVAYRREAT